MSNLANARRWLLPLTAALGSHVVPRRMWQQQQ